MKSAVVLFAIAGITTSASAQTVQVNLYHDDADGTIVVGDSVTWTLEVAFSGGSAASGGNMLISGDNSLGSSTSMTFTPTNGGSNGGASNGAGIGFVNWTNSLFIEAFGGGAADYSNPFVVGTFGFTASAPGTLDYSILKGQASSAFVTIGLSAFSEVTFEIGNAALSIDTQPLEIIQVPAPASAGMLGLIGVGALRRRR